MRQMRSGYGGGQGEYMPSLRRPPFPPHSPPHREDCYPTVKPSGNLQILEENEQLNRQVLSRCQEIVGSKYM